MHYRWFSAGESKLIEAKQQGVRVSSEAACLVTNDAVHPGTYAVWLSQPIDMKTDIEESGTNCILRIVGVMQFRTGKREQTNPIYGDEFSKPFLIAVSRF